MALTNSAKTLRWRDQWMSRSGSERKLRVRWLLDANRSPQENVEITEFRGRIVQIRSLSDAEHNRIMPWILIPPLANLHTHLEFSTLENPLQPAQPFTEWIQSVIDWRRQSHSPGDAVRKGLQESISAGTSLIGDISTNDFTPTMPELFLPLRRLSPLLPDPDSVDVTLVSFHESIGLLPERMASQLTAAEQYLAETHLPMTQGYKILQGLSPHAPYTVHPELLSSLVRLASQKQVPVAMHLAETPDEIELLTKGTGRFQSFLDRMGLFDSRTFPGGRSIREHLEVLALAPRCLVIHGNFLTSEDIDFIARNPHMTVVYCPRTHHWFGHRQYPLEQLLRSGVRVALGTDSRASNPDLDIWKEFQLVLEQFPEIPVESVLAMATRNGYEALGLQPEIQGFTEGAEFSAVAIEFQTDGMSLRQRLREVETRPIGFHQF
jgi:cytosine/adenosine deaminase-related metal-dependent hydrolase